MSANLANDAFTASELRQGAGRPKQVQVVDELSQLEQVAQEGLKLQDELRQRLLPVLRSEPELGEAGGSDAKKASLVPLAERINSLMGTLRTLNSGYSQIMRRLEI